MRDCVARFGGRYSRPEPGDLPEGPRFEHQHERRYGLLDPGSAARWGYNLAPAQQPIDDDPANAWHPEASELLLLRGPDAKAGPPPAPPVDGDGHPLPEGGCLGEADRTLIDGVRPPADVNLANKLSVDAARRAEGDSRVRDAMARWSSCMAARGHTYANVWEANDRAWPDPAGAEEIATATADVACKLETNLAGVWMAVEAAYDRLAMAERGPELAELQAFERTVADHAARVLGGS